MLVNGLPLHKAGLTDVSVSAIGRLLHILLETGVYLNQSENILCSVACQPFSHKRLNTAIHPLLF